MRHVAVAPHTSTLVSFLTKLPRHVPTSNAGERIVALPGRTALYKNTANGQKLQCEPIERYSTTGAILEFARDCQHP